MISLKDKIIVITGASSGIGEKMAWNIAEKGARPVLLARSIDKLQVIAEQIMKQTSVSCLIYQLDISDRNQVKHVFKAIYEEIGHVDILISNAGFGVFNAFHEANMDDMEKMFEVNVLGLMACTQQVLPHMLEQDKGHIVNIASQAGKLATPKTSGYAATKHAVLGFTNALRMELNHSYIYISVVNPGPIKTNFHSIADKSGNYVENVKQYMLQADIVAYKIVRLLEQPKRELNLPLWMNVGSILYNLFPRIADRLVGPFLKRK